MKVNWLLQGSLLFESQGYRLLIDPYISDAVEKAHGTTRLAPPPLSAEELKPSSIYCTHDHMDHLDPVGLPRLLELDPKLRVAGPPSIRSKFEELGLDASRVDVFKHGESFPRGPFTLTVVKAFHTDPEATGLLVEADGALAYVSGDTLFNEGLPGLVRQAAAGKTIDYAFICINGRLGNMDEDEALRTVQAIRAVTAVPMHYGLFAENTADPGPFLARCRKAGGNAMALPPGEWRELPPHVSSLLPPGKNWRLVWSDEFDGDTLDTSKWSFRLHIMQTRHNTFTEEGATLDGQGNLLLELIEKDGQFYSPHLQTGSNYLDRPGEAFGKFRWPVAKIEEPKFMHKYGYYEIRCKLQKQPGWWSAFWLQSPTIGSTLDPGRSGVEVDIMENFSRDLKVPHAMHFNGYGADKDSTGCDVEAEETPDGYHVFGVDWTPEGYIFYVDGKETWRYDKAVSHIEQFILVSTECMGYREGDTPDPRLLEAVLPDYFIVDYVRVFDEIKD